MELQEVEKCKSQFSSKNTEAWPQTGLLREQEGTQCLEVSAAPVRAQEKEPEHTRGMFGKSHSFGSSDISNYACQGHD